MKMSELRQAILQMASTSARHGASAEAAALKNLARVTKPYGDKTIAKFLGLTKPVGKTRKRSKKASKR